MLTPNPDIFMQLFWTYAGTTLWPEGFLICTRNVND